MKSKTIKYLLLSFCSIVSIGAISDRAAIAVSPAEIITQRGTAQELIPVRSRTQADWPWAIGEGTEVETANYEIQRNNNFFRSAESLPSNDRFFNGTNNIGNSLDDSGEAIIVRF
ncbi:MAG: hypothetical protein ACFBSE_27365 [Prochloraceae cyanobacterium]